MEKLYAVVPTIIYEGGAREELDDSPFNSPLLHTYEEATDYADKSRAFYAELLKQVALRVKLNTEFKFPQPEMLIADIVEYDDEDGSLYESGKRIRAYFIER